MDLMTDFFIIFDSLKYLGFDHFKSKMEWIQIIHVIHSMIQFLIRIDDLKILKTGLSEIGVYQTRVCGPLCGDIGSIVFRS